jgi:hypothetical protein
MRGKLHTAAAGQQQVVNLTSMLITQGDQRSG